MWSVVAMVKLPRMPMNIHTFEVVSHWLTSSTIFVVCNNCFWFSYLYVLIALVVYYSAQI